MQREIKFRFFRKLPTPKMIYPKKDFYIGADTGNVYGDIQYSETRQSVKQLDLIPMQFTGLKEKNGVEIYEGDIVISRISGGFNFEPKVVDFTLGSFGIEDHHLHELVEIEVIGNIYENPDMIKDVATQTPKAE